MSPTPEPADDEADPPLLHRLAYSVAASAAAAALFVLVSGVHAGGGAQDARLLVAQCWHQIEEKQALGAEVHELRVACQALESELTTPAVKHGNTVIASQE